jgi:hypothetical protein
MHIIILFNKSFNNIKHGITPNFASLFDQPQRARRLLMELQSSCVRDLLKNLSDYCQALGSHEEYCSWIQVLLIACTAVCLVCSCLMYGCMLITMRLLSSVLDTEISLWSG